MNQYVISSPMPTRISGSASNAAFAQWLKQNVSWNLEGTAPALRRVDTIITSATSVAPGHYPLPYPLSGTAPEPAPTPSATPSATPTPTPNPTPGFEFDVKARPDASATSNNGWNFPSDNSGFGKREFNHVIDGTTYTAPVALFYPSEEKQHPSGGPPGHVVNTDVIVGSIETPNWFYYYSQVWTPPVPIAYWDRNYSWFSHLTGQIHIGSPAHGPSYGFRPLFEMRSGKMIFVGYYTCYGIDAFARVITHEAKHKEIWDSYHQSIDEAENDDVPDVIVDANGNPVLDAGGNLQANDPDADPDNDGLPTWYERSVGLDPMDPDSTGFSSSGGYDGDSEAIARFAENKVGTSPNRDADWADDGLNFGRTPGGRPEDRIKRFALDRRTPLP